MTRFETPFVIDRDLIIIKAYVTGPLRTEVGRFVLDTGAAFTTMIPELADATGYSARDGVKRMRVHTAIGQEEDFLLRIAELAVLGVTMPSFPVHVFDLGHEDIDGLLGMNLLGKFNLELRPVERRIVVQKITG